MQNFVIKCIEAGRFTAVSSTNKTDLHDITDFVESGVQRYKPEHTNKVYDLCYVHYAN